MKQSVSIYYLAFVAIVMTLFGYGLQSNWPWLISEDARLERWEVAMFWAPLFIAMLLFVEHGIGLISGIRFFQLAQNITFRAFVLSVAIECAFGGFSILEDGIGYRRAVHATGQIISGRAREQAEGYLRYTFTCVFVDRNKNNHNAWFSDVADSIPARVRQAIDAKQIHSPIDIMYDPQWPGRTWLAEVPYSQNNRLYIFSFLVLIFSLPLAAGFAFFRKRLEWLPTPSVAPFLAATWVLLMAALIQGW